jgi:molybdopterin-guanine dinucleotide biosynthesis protein A
MGSAKAALIVDGAPLAERTAALLKGVAGPVIEVGPGYTSLAAVQEDPAGQGPLAAMAAGWRALGPLGVVDPAHVLVVATDLPWLTTGLLELLASDTRPGCVVPVDEAGRPQPLCARYPAATMARAGELVARGQRSVASLLDGEEVAWLAPSVWQPAAGRPDALADVDTPEALAGLAGSSELSSCAIDVSRGGSTAHEQSETGE